MIDTAIRLMKKQGLDESIICNFKNHDVVLVSDEGANIKPLTTNLAEEISQYEKESGALVYHVVISPKVMGDMINFLIVPKYQEDWEKIEYITDTGYASAHVLNMENRAFDEFGLIGFRSQDGVLIRTS